MRITITKGTGADRLDIRRDDGSQVATVFPHKGPIPHDFVHHAVECELRLDRAFWGLVADGHHPEDIQAMAQAAGHASAKRAEVPAGDFVAAIQAERIVEAFEADHWSGGSGDPDGVIAMAAAGCAQSHVALPDALDSTAVSRVRARIADFARQWSLLSPGESLALDWSPGA